MGRRLLSCSMSLVTVACIESDLIFIPYPDTAGFASMVLSIEAESGHDLLAADLEVGASALRSSITVEAGEPWETHALLFEKDLSLLGLGPGVLEPAPPHELHPLRLEADAILSRPGTSDSGVRWSRSTEAPDRFRPLLVRNPDPFSFCPELEFSQVELVGATTDVRFMVRLNETEVLAGTSKLYVGNAEVMEQRLYVIEWLGGELEVRSIDVPDTLRLRALTLDADGQIWFAGIGGELFRLTLDEASVSGREFAPGLWPGLDPYWLRVTRNAFWMMDGFGDIYVGARTGTSGVQWRPEPIFSFERGTGRGVLTGELLARGENEVWAVKATERKVVRLRFEGGAFLDPMIDRSLEGVAAIGLSALAEIDGLGVLVGMTDGEIQRYDEGLGSWASLGPSRFTQVAYAVAPAADGFVMAGGTGLFNFYSHPEGYCPLDAMGYKGLRGPSTLHFIVPFREGFLLTGASLGGVSQAVTFLVPK